MAVPTISPQRLFVSTFRTSSFMHRSFSTLPNPTLLFSVAPGNWQHRGRRRPIAFAAHLYTHQTITIDRSTLEVSEADSEEELWAAVCLRLRTFYEFQQSIGIEEHKKQLSEREFEALKDLVAGKTVGFGRVSCINATLPLSHIASFSDDLCTTCKFSDNGEDRVVVGTLNINKCLRLPDEIVGMKPEGIGADFARAYLSNVCVAKELQRNGLGYALISKAKMVAEDWGISDLYVHVAVNNEPARNLYKKSGFIYESDEPAWQARFLDRPRRILMWTGLPISYDL